MTRTEPALLILSLLLSSCLQGPQFLKQGGAPEASVHRVVVPTTEQNGVVTGSISSKSKQTQIISASANSAVAGSSVEFPPGALAIDTDVSIQVGQSLATTSVFNQLDLKTTVASSAAPVAIKSSVVVDATKPFTIAIPLPDSSSLALADVYENLIVVYHINKASDGNADYTGIIGRSDIDTSSGYARVAVTHFGTYQAVITKTHVQAVEVAAAPVVKPAAPSPPPTGPNTRFYFVKGVMPMSFGNDAPQQAGNFQGWVHALSPAKVGNNSTLTFGRISKALPVPSN